MKTIIVILILLAFIQTSILPLNLGLILILTRAFVRQDKVNYFLAFGFGLLLAHLLNLPLGRESLIFVIFVEVVYFWLKTPFARNIWTILPVAGGLLAVTDFLIKTNQFWPQIFWETVLILPIYLAVRFWEERFVVPKEIRLKV